MKTTTAILLSIFLFSCHQPDWYEHKPTKDTVYIYLTDTEEVKKPTVYPYNNFTDTRKVTFDLGKNFDSKTYYISWYLWLDGDIAEDGLVQNVKPENVEAVKAKVSKYCNAKIPQYLKVWETDTTH